jgi:hypothetical protein
MGGNEIRHGRHSSSVWSIGLIPMTQNPECC